HESVLQIARRKADAAQRDPAAAPGEFVVAADTTVVLDGEWIGKPRDRAQARAILRRLRGRTHSVLTAVVVRPPYGGERADVVETKVSFLPLEDSQIDAYVATGEPLDKAGAYGIQGPAAAFVADLEGDYTNVVGLPVRRTLELLMAASYPLPARLRPV